MLTLGIETSSPTGSAALVADGVVINERANPVPNRHAEVLVRLVDELVADSRLQREQIDRIAVGTGPGSFTGLRVGIALASGIATALERPLVGVCSLESVACGFVRHQQSTASGHIVVLQDARREEVFCSCYDHQGAVLHAPQVVSQKQILQHLEKLVPRGPGNLVGANPQQFAPEGGWPSRFTLHHVAAPQASVTALIAERLNPNDTPVVPHYLRGADATKPRLRSNPLLSPRQAV